MKYSVSDMPMMKFKWFLMTIFSLLSCLVKKTIYIKICKGIKNVK